MKVLEEYRSTQEELKALEAKLTALEGSDRLKRELELVDKFNALLEETGFSLKDALKIVNPNAPSDSGTTELAGNKRSPRRESIYKNPFTGETVTTKGANHRVIRAWKTQYGDDKVKAWKVS